MTVPDQTANDIPYMQQALDLARQGEGHVSPNPLVGCVIVNNGTIVGRGFHQRFGGPHAEVHALRDAGPSARGAVVYVTLEPCSHTGKTPPCADAVIAAGVSRVVAAIRDPNPLVAGQGLARVAAAGIAVTVGVCEEDARKLNEAFIKHITTGRPFVTLKSALTLDGKIATRTGASQWITGEPARQAGHRLRHAMDAILVGLGTVLHDNPQLTARLPDQASVNPLRVIVDSTLQVPLHAHVVDVAPERRTLIATTARAATEAVAQLQARGVEVVRLPAYDDGRVDLDALCRTLGERGIASLLVEGGATLSATLLQRRLVDKVLFFVAPKIIGGDGLSAVGSCGIETMAQVIRLRDITTQRLGDDVVFEAYLAR